MPETPPDTITYDGLEFFRICGYPMSGNFMSFPCCLVPEHEGEHMFAASYARYVLDEETGAMYMREGR